MRSWLGVCALWSLGACTPAPAITTVTLELHSLPSCALPEVPSIVVRATGDFSAPKPPPALAPGMQATLDGLPTGTRFLGIDAQAGKRRFGSLVARSQGPEQRSALLLPLEANSSCPLGDPLARAPRGAAVAALPGGGLLIAGGSDAAGMTLASAVVLRPGQTLVDDVVGGMLLSRAGASATPVDARVVVAGGGSDDGGSVQSTLEVYDAVKGVFDRASDEHMSAPRRDHGAARLGDGRVLLVGGCQKLGAAPVSSDVSSSVQEGGSLPRCVELAGTPLASAELIDLEAPVGMIAHATHDLATPRIAPSVLVLDSGSVLVALGWDEHAMLVSSIERFDPSSETFTPVELPLPAHRYAAVAALEGDRIAYLGCDGPGHGCELVLLLPDADGFVDAGELISSEELAANGLSDLAQVALLALGDGRLFVAGRAPDAPIVRRGFFVDLDRLTVESDERSLSRAPDRLLELGDGTRVELNTAGISLARASITSPLDTPPADLIAKNDPFVTLDAPSRWETTDRGELHALSGLGQPSCPSGSNSPCDAARLDLPFLRFADMRVKLMLEGAGELLLEPEAMPPIAVALEATKVSLGGCTILRVPDEPIEVERRGAALTLTSGDNSRRCEVPRAVGRLGVALRVQAGAYVRGLGVTRL